MATKLNLKSLGDRISGIEQRLESIEESLRGSSLTEELPLAQYPQPIAYPLAEERAADNYADRFSRMLDVSDACIKYTAALSLCLRWPDAGFKETARILIEQPPSLGKWHSVIPACKGLADKQRSKIAPRVEEALMDSLYKPNGRLTHAGKFLLEIVGLRNDEKGHAFTQSDAAYERIYRRDSVTLHESLSSLTHLELPLTRIEKMDLAAGDDFKYTVRMLVGESQIGSLSTVVCPLKMKPDQTCVWDRGEILISLQGLVIYTACDAGCNLQHTFLFKKRMKNGKVEYQSPVGNHRITLPAPEWVDQVWESIKE